MTGSLRGILFDMDGVLVESYEVWYALLLEAVSHFGGAAVSAAAFRAAFGQSVAADCASFLPHVTPADLDRFYNERFTAHAGHVVLLAGAGEALDWCRARGLRVGCVTNASGEVARAVLASAGLLPRLETLVTADEVAEPKPAPDLVIEGARRLGLTPADVAMVGDSRYDVAAARAAGALALTVGGRACGDHDLASLDALDAALAPLLAPGLRAPA